MQGLYKKKKDGNCIDKIIKSDYTIKPLTEDMWANFENVVGASAPVVVTLPAAKVGMGFRAHARNTCGIRFDPAASEYVCLPSSGAKGTHSKYLTGTSVDAYLEAECREDGVWAINTYIGTWSKES